MSAKILAGMTHAIVIVPPKTDAQASGVRAAVELCYGPGDSDAIGPIQLVEVSTDPIELAWRGPHVPVTSYGRKIMVPVFRGEAHEQVCNAAARAVERIKRDCGTVKYGTRYRVDEVRAVEEPAA